MCGIAGIAFSEKSRRRIDESVLRRMSDAIHHRGPDDAGIFISENIGLAHRRLAIVDVSAGFQPMTNEDCSLQIVFNGEIYNHADFRDELVQKGHVYKTHCDTETILHLYEEHGASCVEHLRGMFAFAIWDSAKKELLLARDRLGVKPLYYVLENGSLFFASEIKSLFEAGIKPEINYAALPDQMANHGTTGEETLFRNVKRLLPGHFLIWKNGEIRIKKFWDVLFQPKIEVNSERDLVEEWRELFSKSVELRLMADVPLGMFLSGGIDSSAIAAEMAMLVKEPIKTFSVAFAEREANELEYARLVSSKLKTDHHEITVSPQEFFDVLPKLVWHEDEPIGFLASVPLYFVSKLAQQHVKVVLTGEGSDELLGGYGRYRKTLLNLAFGENYESFAPRRLRSAVQSGIGTLPVAVKNKLSRTFLNLPSDLENLYFDNFAVFSRKMQERILSEETKAQIFETNPYSNLKDYLSESDAVSLLDKLLYADTKTYLHELLMKQDQMSMAASIESRVPFLDHKLVEFTARLPEKFKIRGKTTKWILREAMRNVLPAEILTRKKMGFPVPFGNWLREEFRSIVDEFVLSERALNRRIFNADFVREIVNRHNAGENHDERMWFLINFEIWQRQFIEGEKLC
ncbi:MAG TPA: asparagine synthase (glutamine-hydrolyzing) [Pyrinomonadaceae bacterium]|jgi:asparagine synthase (glutamine-hydrolysing)